MERETGIEPATNSLEGCDSTTELLPPSLNARFARNFGGQARVPLNRLASLATPDKPAFHSAARFARNFGGQARVPLNRSLRSQPQHPGRTTQPIRLDNCWPSLWLACQPEPR